jgi:hypothetical protein
LDSSEVSPPLRRQTGKEWYWTSSPFMRQGRRLAGDLKRRSRRGQARTEGDGLVRWVGQRARANGLVSAMRAFSQPRRSRAHRITPERTDEMLSAWAGVASRMRMGRVLTTGFASVTFWPRAGMRVERRNLGVKPPAGHGASACPLCSATFGNAVIELCELAMDRRQIFFLFTCGSCKATLVASMDHVGRVGITLNVSGLSGESPVIAPSPGPSLGGLPESPL